MPEAPGVAWLEGRVVPLGEARVPVTDRGFLFADSVFDTVRTYGGRPFLLGDHLDRLRSSASAIDLSVPWSDAELGAWVAATLTSRGFDGEAAVRVIVTRGDGGHGLAVPEPTVPRLVILCRPAPVVSAALGTSGVSLARPAEARSKAASVPSHVKSGAYLANVLALHEGRATGGFEALLMGDDGSWSEATTSNVFAVFGGKVITPGADAGILPGITRALVLALCRSIGLEVEIRSLWDADLEAADELFITSSLKEVMAAVTLDARAVGTGAPGPVTASLERAFRRAVGDIASRGATRMVQVFP